MRNETSLEGFLADPHMELSSYDKECIADAQWIVDQMRPFRQCRIMVRYEGGVDSLARFESIDARFTDVLDFRVSYDKRKKKYAIHTHDLQSIKDIRPDRSYKNDGEHAEPNDIGVLTAKKVNDWVNYYKTKHADLMQISAANRARKDEFIRQLDGREVQWGWEYKKDKTKPMTGQIYKGGMVFSFFEGDEYFSTRIELEPVGSDFETFDALADNRYVKPKYK
jgi:hypothetical protein